MTNSRNKKEVTFIVYKFEEIKNTKNKEDILIDRSFTIKRNSL